ncbi:MAG TPA: DUF6510 family protein [Gemmatimonadaceae bacterium]
MQVEEMRLDGNAAAGLLSEIFAPDVTVARATCGGCGADHAVGELLDYGQEMGTILRCPDCNSAMMRVVAMRRAWRIDASGMVMLIIPRASSAAPA